MWERSSHSGGNQSTPAFDSFCFVTDSTKYVYTAAMTASTALTLPPCVLILRHGLRRWRRGRPSSHADSFVHHMVAMDLAVLFRNLLTPWGLLTEAAPLANAGVAFSAFTWWGHMLFHMLTCVERYLAVVHPVAYRGLSRGRGARIRNACICAVWLLSCAGFGLMWVSVSFIALDLVTLLMSVALVTFCSLAVMRALSRPCPAGGGGGRPADPAKTRAFYTILAVLGVLVLKLAWLLSWIVFFYRKTGDACFILTSEFLFSVPGSLVLPMLYLRRAGALGCCRGTAR